MAPDSLHLRDPYYSNAEGNNNANNIRTTAMKFFAEKFGWKLASDKEADGFSTYLNSEVDRSTVCDSSKKVKPIGGSGYYVQIITMKTINQVPNPRPKLKNSQIPVLIMKGQCDNQKWGFVTEYLELFPNHTLTIIPSAGHFIWVEQPELYLKTLQTFLNN
jgi:proline iminopeptidase